jgi:hypothetical protein
MVDLSYKHNARHLGTELAWFRQVVETRFKLHHRESCPFGEITEVPAPKLNGDASLYQHILEHFQLSLEERLILILALVPHIQPNALDDFLATINPRFRSEQFGNGANGFVPTVETALFLLAGDNLERRFYCLQLFEPEAPLFSEKVLTLRQEANGTSILNTRLDITREFLGLITSGRAFQPEYSHAFPAKRLTTAFEWGDLVLPPKTRAQVDELKAWIKHGDTVLYDWELVRKFPPGLAAG